MITGRHVIYTCKSCFTKNRIDLLVFPPSGHAYCGKCKAVVATFKGNAAIHTVKPARKPPKPRGICGCCGQKPCSGDKLVQGFCPDCWAGMDGLGRPPRRY